MHSLGFVGFRRFGGVLSALTTRTCLARELCSPGRVDLYRNISNGETVVQASSSSTFNYRRDGKVEKLYGVPLQHSCSCPALAKEITNPSRPMRLSCCVLMKLGDSFLATKRSRNISFPGAWVLPGGGVDNGETVFQAGLRECEEEVGKKFSAKRRILSELEENNNIMLWESHYVRNLTICRGHLIIFITIPTQNFDVRVQPSEVSDYKWMTIDEGADGDSYSEADQDGFPKGHLRYLNLVRNSLPVPARYYY